MAAIRSPEYQFGAHPRFADLEPALCLRAMTDPRTTALLLQMPVGLRPRRQFVCILNPTGNGGLIAPSGAAP